MPDDHSEVVPPLPIPNRTVKHLCADDSAGSRVKVGHRQASIRAAPPHRGAFSSVPSKMTLKRTRKARRSIQQAPIGAFLFCSRRGAEPAS